MSGFNEFIEYIHELDVSFLRTINSNRFQELDNFFIFITDTSWIITYVLPIMLILFFFITKNKTDIRKPSFVLVSVIISFLLVSLIKYYVDRPRPFALYSFIEKMTLGGSPSFPSGHTSDVFAFSTAICLVHSRKIFFLVYIWAFLVAYSRMHLGVHYPSDVVAGAIIGIVSSLICYRAFRALPVYRSSG